MIECASFIKNSFLGLGGTSHIKECHSPISEAEALVLGDISLAHRYEFHHVHDRASNQGRGGVTPESSRPETRYSIQTTLR